MCGHEIAYQAHCGKLRVPFARPDDFAKLLERWDEFPLTLHHAVTAGHLPLPHRESFDRLLAAQATSDGFRLISNDPALTSFPELDVLW